MEKRWRRWGCGVPATAAAKLVPAVLKIPPPSAAHSRRALSHYRVMSQGLPFQVDELLQEGIRDSYHTGVGLVAALGGDNICELLAQVHVGHLQGTGGQRAAAARAWLHYLDVAGVAGVGKVGASHLLQTGGVVKGCQVDTAQLQDGIPLGGLNNAVGVNLKVADIRQGLRAALSAMLENEGLAGKAEVVGLGGRANI